MSKATEIAPKVLIPVDKSEGSGVRKAAKEIADTHDVPYKNGCCSQLGDVTKPLTDAAKGALKTSLEAALKNSGLPPAVQDALASSVEGIANAAIDTTTQMATDGVKGLMVKASEKAELMLHKAATDKMQTALTTDQVISHEAVDATALLGSHEPVATETH